jgi:hypothetical protein
MRDYTKAASTSEPVFSDHNFRKLNGFHMDIERVILPLSSDGQSIVRFVAVLEFQQSSI